METYELECRYDSRKSFYGKARVCINNGKIALYSYNTKVAEIDGNKLSVLDLRSQTTRRHVVEFARQHNFEYKKLNVGEYLKN